MSQVCSIFSQLLKLFPRAEFEQAVRQHRGSATPAASPAGDSSSPCCFASSAVPSRCARSAAAWRPAKASCGIWACPPLRRARRWPTPTGNALGRSTKPSFSSCWRSAAARRRATSFRFKNKLLSLDASVIDLCASLFDWAQFRRTKGAVKLHLVLDHDGYLPSFCVVTDGKTPDLAPARQMLFDPGTIVVFDRGYNDYDWFAELSERGVFFVTRLKRGADYEVLEQRPLPRRPAGVRRDEVIFFPSLAASGSEVVFRRIEYYDAEQQRTLVFLTNHLELAAATIAAIYQDRWQIELFFKALKQNLRVKTFVGTSANALKIQIWTALIAILLLRYLKLRARWGWSLSNLVALLRQQLFVHRELFAWLDEPFHPAAGRRTRAAAAIITDGNGGLIGTAA